MVKLGIPCRRVGDWEEFKKNRKMVKVVWKRRRKRRKFERGWRMENFVEPLEV